MQATRARKPKPAPVPARAADVNAKELKKVENAASRPEAPQAFPGQVRHEPEMDTVERKQAIAAGAWQKLHENDAAGAAAAGTVSQNAPATRDALAPAANAATTAAQVETPAAPPYQTKHSKVRQPTYSADVIRNSHLYPESWIAAIHRLIRDGQREEAMQNLDLFHNKYPSYHLSADLERLLATPK